MSPIRGLSRPREVGWPNFCGEAELGRQLLPDARKAIRSRNLLGTKLAQNFVMTPYWLEERLSERTLIT